MSTDICIGYWADKYGLDEYPMPEPNTARPDQARIIANLDMLMERGYSVQYRGSSNCRLCGKLNGSRELEVIKGDTKYRIPFGYLHYLREHKVGYDERLKDIL